jgi:hypothetical protein
MKDNVIQVFIETEKFRQIYVQENSGCRCVQHTSLKTQVQANNSKLVS